MRTLPITKWESEASYTSYHLVFVVQDPSSSRFLNVRTEDLQGVDRCEEIIDGCENNMNTQALSM